MKNKYLLGVFNDEDQVIDAFEELKQKKYPIEEVYSPYPIHEVLHGMGNKTYMTHAAFAIGVLAICGLIGAMYYVAVISWPLVFGGKPFAAFPSFIVVTIVATILIITLGTIVIFQLRSKIYPGKKITPIHDAATDDKFIIVLDHKSIEASQADVEGIFSRNGAVEVIEKESEKV